MQLFGTLRELRQKRGLSLSQVFEKSGIDRAALSRLENGQVTNPTVATLENFAHALGARVRFVVEVDEN
ncbi:MAG: helix-turn-helix domain-containing protein [Planctomycetia bacterium]|nr:helix-turn-helix domain-containing protein [Planctomycetia bacterium]